MKKMIAFLSVMVGFCLVISAPTHAGGKDNKSWKKSSHWDKQYSKHSKKSKSGKHHKSGGKPGRGGSCNGGGHDPQPECGCDGKVNYLKLRYDGAYDSTVVINQHKGEEVFSQTLTVGQAFEIYGVDKKGTLSPTITIDRDGSEIDIHTSCSEPIGPGTLIVDPVAQTATGEAYAFVILEGSSRNIDTLCDQGDVPPAPEPPTEILPPIVDAGPDITIVNNTSISLPNVDELFGIPGNTGAFERVAALLQVDGDIVSYEWTQEEIFYTETLRRDPLGNELLVANSTTDVCSYAEIAEGETCSIERYTITVTDENGLSDSDSFTVTTISDQIIPEILPPIVEAGPDITIVDQTSVSMPNVDIIYGEAGNTGAFERLAELLQVDGAIVSYVWTREELLNTQTLRNVFDSDLLVASFSNSVCSASEVSGDTCSVERYTITVTDENGLSDSDSFTVTTLRAAGGAD